MKKYNVTNKATKDGRMVTERMLTERYFAAKRLGYSKQKWIEFCEYMMRQGYQMRIKETQGTTSKYITVFKDGGTRAFKVRFSNHKPNKRRELNGDCDFFVGMTHTGTRTTDDATRATLDFFELQQERA